MNLREFRRAGHWPTLVCALAYFDVSFMVWVLVGALANSIIADFGLSDAQTGLLVAVPILGGAILRLGFGVLADHLGGRRTGIVGLLLTLVPLWLGWWWATSYSKLLLVGMLLGVAGASFAVALPLASRWYPPRCQGLVMGIAGAGNSGTALATFFGPRLAEKLGWQAVFGLALAPVLATLASFALWAKDSPQQPRPKRLSDYAAVLGQRDTWWFSVFYSVTFGGFVGLASFLSIFFHSQYKIHRVDAAALATLGILAGSFLRPVGGYLADRVGGIRMLVLLYAGAGLLTLDLATSPPLVWAAALVIIVMGLFGMGNGSVFQLVPQRFPREIGAVTGLVGAAGGVGGFLLPALLGTAKQLTGSFSGGWVIFSLVAFCSAAAVVHASEAWEGTFVAEGGRVASDRPARLAPLVGPEMAGCGK